MTAERVSPGIVFDADADPTLGVYYFHVFQTCGTPSLNVTFTLNLDAAGVEALRDISTLDNGIAVPTTDGSVFAVSPGAVDDYVTISIRPHNPAAPWFSGTSVYLPLTVAGELARALRDLVS